MEKETKQYLIRWLKNKEDTVNFGSIVVDSYEEAIALCDVLQPLLKLKEFSGEDLLEIVPALNNIFYEEEDDEDDTEPIL